MDNEMTPEQQRYRMLREREQIARANFLRDLANKALNKPHPNPTSPEYMGLIPSYTKQMMVPMPNATP